MLRFLKLTVLVGVPFGLVMGVLFAIMAGAPMNLVYGMLIGLAFGATLAAFGAWRATRFTRRRLVA